jgi:hypothetical protein
MMVMVMVVMMLLFATHYFKILYSNDVNEIKILVAVNQSVVDVPMVEFLAFTVLGSTYTLSFCCR